MPHKKEPLKQRRIGESGYVLPDHIPPGEIVNGLKSEDDGVKKESWRIGKSIGKQYDIPLIFGPHSRIFFSIWILCAHGKNALIFVYTSF